MASFTASASTVSAARPALLLKPTVAISAPVLGKKAFLDLSQISSFSRNSFWLCAK